MAQLDEQTLTDLMKTHNLGVLPDCLKTIGDNRVRDEASGYYCWKGIIYQQPECVIGTVCDPISYTNARTRFCLSFGACRPSLLVHNPEDDPSQVPNRRGGIVVNNQYGSCDKSSGFVKCVKSGIKQSVNNATSADNKKKTMTSVIALMGAVLVGALIIGYNRPRILSYWHIIKPRKTY